MIDNELIYLNAINELLDTNMSELPSDLKPKTKEEFYLEKIFKNLAGITSELPIDLKPHDRREILLAVIEKNSRDISQEGGGGTVPPPPVNPDEWGMVYNHLTETTHMNVSPDVVKVNLGANVSQTKVADDVSFGPTYENAWDSCEHEVFIFNPNTTEIKKGALQLVSRYCIDKKLIYEHAFTLGDLYSIELDNTQIEAYERLIISPTKQAISTHNVSINSVNFAEVDGYTITDKINIDTVHTFSSNVDVVTDNDSYTYATIEVDETKFNEIQELQ